MPKLEQEELLAVALDFDVFAATQDTLADVRLSDAAGKPIPYLLRKAQTTRAAREKKIWPARRFSARPHDDGLVITVELDKDDPHPNGLTIVSPLRNFEQRVSVETSADAVEWTPVDEETVIFDYSRYLDVRNDSISFPETARRNFRIIIDDVTVEQRSELQAFARRLRKEATTNAQTSPSFPGHCGISRFFYGRHGRAGAAAAGRFAKICVHDRSDRDGQVAQGCAARPAGRKSYSDSLLAGGNLDPRGAGRG